MPGTKRYLDKDGLTHYTGKLVNDVITPMLPVLEPISDDEITAAFTAAGLSQ